MKPLFRKKIPRVVITSHLPADKEKRTLRLSYHKRQLDELYKNLPAGDCDVMTLASGYSAADRRKLPYAVTDVDDVAVSKWEKHNLVLSALYAREKPHLQTVLLLDDDVVPRPLKEGDVEGGLVNTYWVIDQWLNFPSAMCGQCGFFASAGLRFDAFWKANHPLVKAPPQVVGWAMMVRGDLQVLYDKELVTDPATGLVSTDYPFRTKCLAMGKEVVKHNRAFWKTFQNIQNTEKTSTWVGSHEERLKGRAAHVARMKRMFPEAFQRAGKTKTDGGAGKGFFGA